MENKKAKISTGTITRTILLALALINQLLVVSGNSPIPIADEVVAEFIASGATIIMAIIAFWKNNSFTKEAIEADEQMHKAKDAR